MKTMIGNATVLAVQTGRRYLQNLLSSTQRSLLTGIVAIASCGMVAHADELEVNSPGTFKLPSYLSDADASIAAAGPVFAGPEFQDEPVFQDKSDEKANSTNGIEPGAETPAFEPRSEQSLRGAIESLSENEQSDLTEDPAVDVERRSIFADRKTSFTNGKLVLPEIKALTTETNGIGNGQVPLGFRQGADSPNIALPESGLERVQPWNWTAYHFAAPNTFSHPLYFEDRMLERHGHQRFPLAQPFVSGGRFMAQAFMLPYLGAINPPSECQYTLGYFRAGSCVHPYIQRPPYQRKAAASQAAGIVSGIAIFP